MWLVVGLVAFLVSILFVGWVFQEEIKKAWKNNKKKIVAVAMASSAASGGLMMLPDSALEDMEMTLIDSLDVYEKFGFDVDKIEKPYIYEKEILCEGHMPFVVQLNLSSDIYMDKADSSNLLRTTQDYDKVSFKNKLLIDDFEYKILVKKDYSYDIPVYEEVEKKISIFNNTTQKSEFILKTEEIVTDYETIEDYKYVWEDLSSYEQLLKSKNALVIDIVGYTKAQIGKRKVDIIPTLSFEKQAKTFPQYAWWNSNWLFYKSITWDTSQIPSELHNVPILINITDTDLRDNAQADGGDIAFVSHNNLTQYYHEIEEYDSTTGYLAAWVNVTSINTTIPIIGMYYGNAGAADQWDAANTWNDNYSCVLHMNQDPTGGADTFTDSTGSGNDGTPVNLDAADSITGIASNCINFDGGGERLSLDSSAATFGTYDKGTFECWGLPDADSGYYYTLNDYDDAADYIYHAIRASNDYVTADIGDGGSWRFDGDTDVATGKFVHVVGGSYGNGVGNNFLYTDGLENSLTFLQGSNDGTHWDDTDGGEDTFSLGGLYRASPIWSTITIDEFRVSTTVRSADYYLLLYNNGANASDGGFYTLGYEIGFGFTNESPTDDSTNQQIIPRVSIDVEESTGASFDLTFASNYSGSWTNYQTNTSCSNGTYTWDFTGANVCLQSYWWKVYKDNGTDNVTSRIYKFTTGPAPSVQELISPQNESIWIDFSPTCTVNVTANPYFDSVNVSFSSNYSGSWITYKTDTYVTVDTTSSWDFTGASDGLTTYWWKVITSNGTYSNTYIYHFTTKEDISDWQYYKQFDICDGNNSNYNLLINVTNSSGGDINCESHAQADFDDIRFYRDDTTSNLSYYISEVSNSNYAIFIVTLPTDITVNDTLRIYYGYVGTGNISEDDRIYEGTLLHSDDFSTDPSLSGSGQDWYIGINGTNSTTGLNWIFDYEQLDGTYNSFGPYGKLYLQNTTESDDTGLYLHDDLDTDGSEGWSFGDTGGSETSTWKGYYQDEWYTIQAKSSGIGTAQGEWFHANSTGENYTTGGTFNVVSHNVFDRIHFHLDDSGGGFSLVTGEWDNTNEDIHFRWERTDLSLYQEYRFDNLYVYDILTTYVCNVQNEINTKTPNLDSPSPANNSIGASIDTDLGVSITHPLGISNDIEYRTNASGSWETIDTATNIVNGSSSITTSGYFTEYNTKYWWSANASDVDGYWDNETYNFITEFNTTGYNYNEIITIDSTYVDADITDFVVPVEINHTISQYCDSGNSILFTTSSGGLLYHDLEFFSDNVPSYCHVRIPASETITSASDYTFKLYFNNSNAVSTANATEVWENYEMVYHFSEASGDIIDKTGNTYNATVAYNPTYRAGGQFGYSMDFDGSEDFCAIQNKSYSSTTLSDMLVLAIVKSETTFTGTVREVFSFDESDYYSISTDSDSEHPIWTTENDALEGDEDVTNNTWVTLTGVFNSGTRYLYINEYQNQSDVVANTFGSGNTRYGFIAEGSDATSFNGTISNTPFNGKIDEIIVRESIPSELDAWVKLKHNLYNGNAISGVDNTWGEPVLNSASPSNGTTCVEYAVDITVDISDPDNENMDVHIFSNYTDAEWIEVATINDVTDGEYTATDITEFSNSDTKYWYAVNVSDATGNSLNETRYFTTADNQAVNTYYPSNTSTDIDYLPTLFFNVTSTCDVDASVSFYENTTGSWVLIETDTGINSGNGASCTYDEVLEGDTMYWWKVVVDNGYDDTTTYIYHFTTTANPTAEVSYPTHQTMDVEKSPTVSVWANESDGRDLKVTFYRWTGASYSQSQVNDSVSSGTLVEWIYAEANTADTLYNWSVKVQAYEDTTLCGYIQVYKEFTTAEAPVIDSYVPSDGTWYWSVKPVYFNVTISDPSGLTMDIELHNGSGFTDLFNSSSSVSNGTVSHTNNTWVDDYDTIHWSISVVNSKGFYTNDTTPYFYRGRAASALFTSTNLPVTNTPVSFTDSSTNATSWDWDFGDANTSTNQNPNNNYSYMGNYTVNLTINDGETYWQTVYYETYIYIGYNQTISSGEDYFIWMGNTSTITDINTTIGTSNYTYYWDGSTWNNTGTLSVPQFSVLKKNNSWTASFRTPANHTVDYSAKRNVSLSTGWNVEVWTNNTASTTKSISTGIPQSVPEFVSYWDGSAWVNYIATKSPDSYSRTVNLYDIIIIAMDDSDHWVEI